MKLRAVLMVDYEISTKSAEDNYGTIDPEECAKIDQENFDDDPGLLITMGDSTVSVSVIEP